MKDYYKILGIGKQASLDEVKKAYRRLAHKHHPDKGGDAERFKEISEAYQVLSDQEKRTQYDKFGRTFEGSAPGFGGFSWGWGPGQGFEEGFGFDFQDLGEMFEDFLSQTDQRSEVKRGRDLEIQIEIPLKATLKGAEHALGLSRLSTCSRCSGVGAEPGTNVNECFACRGSGEVQQIRKTVFGSFTRVGTCPECSGEGLRAEKPCNVCNGEGRVRENKEVTLFVPPGVDTNQILRVDGMGDAGPRKGKAGNLYVRILVKPHERFERRGDDLYTTQAITFSQAALGDAVQVKDLADQLHTIEIPAGAKSGDVVRLRGKGIPHFGGLGSGDLHLRLAVSTPKKLTKRQKEVLQKLREEGL